MQSRGVEWEQDRELREREENRQTLQAEREAAEAREQEEAADLDRRIEAYPSARVGKRNVFSGEVLRQYLSRKTGKPASLFAIPGVKRFPRHEDLAREVIALRGLSQEQIRERVATDPRYRETR